MRTMYVTWLEPKILFVSFREFSFSLLPWCAPVRNLDAHVSYVCATQPIDRPVNICSCSVRALTSLFSDITYIILGSVCHFVFFSSACFLSHWANDSLDMLVRTSIGVASSLHSLSPNTHTHIFLQTRTHRAVFWYLIRYKFHGVVRRCSRPVPSSNPDAFLLDALN